MTVMTYDFDALFAGSLSPEAVEERLRALADRGERVEDIVAAVTAMRRRMVPVMAPPGAIDVCGTGGDGSHSLNISTAVAIVTAACGVPVAKHGNRAATSRAGAADTIEALGIMPAITADVAERELAGCGLTFLFAPAFHPALGPLAPVRRAIGRRTILNLVGPLASPARVTRQLIGLARPDLLDAYAEAVLSLGTQRTMLVSGFEGLDELSIAGPSRVLIIADNTITERMIEPADADVPAHSLDAIRGGDARHNAAALMALLEGEPGGYADAVILNSAAALWVAGVVADLAAGGAMARNAIRSGSAAERVLQWRSLNRQHSE